jgi:hypothetical protein
MKRLNRHSTVSATLSKIQPTLLDRFSLGFLDVS